MRFETAFKDNLFFEMPDIRYGEKERIIEAAKKALDSHIKMYEIHGSDFERPKLAKLADIEGISIAYKLKELLIEKLGSYEGTKEILDIIVSEYNLVGLDVSEEEAELIEIFQRIRANLEEL